jgi:hypothetical protein
VSHRRDRFSEENSRVNGLAITHSAAVAVIAIAVTAISEWLVGVICNWFQLDR